MITGRSRTATVNAEPYYFEFDPKATAPVIIDMQRDFVDPVGFDEALGNNFSLLQKAILPTKQVLEAARDAKLLVIHTREEQRPDLPICRPPRNSAVSCRQVLEIRGPWEHPGPW
jgi:nicotinamidase-related amidase